MLNIYIFACDNIYNWISDVYVFIDMLTMKYDIGHKIN